MKKCINFTGRKRIPQRHIELEVFDGSPRRFDAAINLAGLDFPYDAPVFLEAMCAGSTVIQRFQFGIAGEIVAPTNRRLDEIRGENVFFRLKVIDQSERFGRILGIAEKLRPNKAGEQTSTGRRGILPIELVPLGQQLWQLHYGDQDVCLQVNESVPGIKDRARWDKVFQGYVYPAVIREILARAISNNAADDEESDKWDVLWLRFGRNLHPERESAPRGPLFDDVHWEWIDAVVDEFCNLHRLRDICLPSLATLEGEES